MNDFGDDSLNAKWWMMDSGSSAPEYNMALDEALLEFSVELQRPIIRFYGWSRPAATFGYFQKHAEVSSLTRLRPLIRRCTGGGLVPHENDWTYSVVVPPSDPWYQLTAVESYRQLHEWIRDAFFRRGVSCELASQGDPAGPGQCFIGWEKYDLVRAGKKIGGAAQRRKRLGLLIQGSIQPTPKELPRADWQRAMIQCVPNSGSPPTIDRLEGKIYDRLIHRTAELVSIRYSNEEYQQKR